MKSFSKLLLIIPVLTWTSCDKSTTDTTLSIEETEPEIIWDWENFPKSTELTLRSMPCSIQPKQTFELKSEASGIMTFLITEKETTVIKDQLIAKMDVESLEEAEERIELGKEQRFLEELKTNELELPEQRRKAEEELSEAKRKVKLLEKILNSPAMAEIANELFPRIGDVDSKALEKAKTELTFLERKFVILEDVDKKLRKAALRLQDMDLAKSERQHEDVKERSQYKAPFAGELRLEVNYLEGQTEYTVGSRETIATINNYEEIHAHVQVLNAKWANLEPEQIYVQLNDRDKTIMNFNDDRIDRDERTRKEERKFIFSIPLEENVSLKRLSGTDIQGDLIYKLPESCYIIPKYDLSLYALGKTQSLKWKSMVKQLWPEAEVLAEGRKNLAIKF